MDESRVDTLLAAEVYWTALAMKEQGTAPLARRWRSPPSLTAD